MPTQVPKGWVQTTFGEICAPSRERALPSEDPDLPYVGMEHVEAHTMKLLGHGQAHELKSSAVRFKKGDVLFGKMRPYLNKVWLAEFDGLCSAEFLVFPKTEGVNNQLLAYRLNSQDFINFANHQVSGERPRVDFDKLARFRILLPPSREQDSIVAKLDTLLSHISMGEAAARRALDRLQCYRAAVLRAAVTGELTREWRNTHQTGQDGAQLLRQLLAKRRARWEEAELKLIQGKRRSHNDDTWKKRYSEPTPVHTQNLPSLPKDWIWASLDQLGELNRGKSRHRPRNDPRLYGGPHPFIQTGDIRQSGGTIREHHQTYTEFGLKQSRLWPAGTLCITIAANIAETGVLTYPACFPDSVVGFVQDEKVLSVRFVEFFIRSEKEKLERYAPATAQKNINLEVLKGLAVPLPPLLEQREIVRTAQDSLAAADHLASVLCCQLERAREMRQSLFHDAFIGNLVSQNPNDEPASVLLKRIRTVSKSTVNTPKAKHMAKLKMKSVKTVEELEELIENLGRAATPERILLAAGLEEDVETFFDLLRSGRDNGSLHVPIGKSTAIRRVQHAS